MAIKIIKDQAGTSALVEGIDVEPIPLNAFLCSVTAGNGGITIFNPEAPDNNGNPTRIMKNVPFTEFVKSDGTIPVDANDLKADIDAQLEQPAPTDVNIGYKSVYHANTNVPDIIADINDYKNGDWFFVETTTDEFTVDLGNGNVTVKTNDQVKLSVILDSGGTETDRYWTVISDNSATVDDITNSTLDRFDIHVDGDYTGSIQTGSSMQPFSNIPAALAVSSPNDSLLLKGDLREPNTTSDLYVLPHSLNIYATEDCVTGYESYNATNGTAWKWEGTDYTAEFKFYDVKVRHAGKYGIHLIKGAKWEGRRLDVQFCGWDGDLTVFNPYVPTTISGATYGSDSTDLSGFYPSAHASDGGAIRIEEFTRELDVAHTITNNLRALRLQDCGVGGNGFQTRNRIYGNIESGLYYALGTTFYGCQNMTSMKNYIAYNANNGGLIVGGINNKFGANEIHSNWNAGVCNFAGANVTIRDAGIYNNNRSAKNGIGNNGDAMGSVQYNDAYSYLATTFSVNPDRRFLMSVTNTQIHNTGLGKNTETTGIFFDVELSNLPASDKNIISIDNVEFIGQDVAIDMSAIDTTNLTIVKGDNSYINVKNKVKEPLDGYYYELPFSNHVISLEEANFSVTNTGNVIIKDGVSGTPLNPYFVNDLQALAHGSDIKIVLKGTRKIQFTVPVSGCSIGNSMVNSVLALALVQLNDLLTNTAGFASGGNPVTDFYLSGNDLVIILQDGTSYTADVTTLGVDENKFVEDFELVGSNLVLTMNDGVTTHTVSVSNMINGSTLPARAENWYIAYGNNAGDEVVYASVVADIKAKQPFYNGDFLEKGEEYVWTNNISGYSVLGIYTGPETTSEEDIVFADNKWAVNFKFISSKVSPSSIGVDVSSRYASGYDITNNTVLALRYGNDNYLYLLDISNGDEVIIGKSNLALVGDSVTIFMGGENQPNAKFPVMVKRFEQWAIVHDYDNSENGEWNDGVEIDTIIKSNMTLNPGEKILLNVNYFGRAERIGLGYTGAATGVSNAFTNIEYALVYNSAELLFADDTLAAAGGSWTWNQNANYFWNPNGDGSSTGYWNNGGVGNLGLISFIYNTDNTVQLYHEGNGEFIADLATTLDGSPINLYIGFNEAHPVQRIPAISRQDLNGGSQPVTTFAPDISDQSFDLTEGEAFNVEIALDAGSDIVNIFGEENAPSWAVLNQATGKFIGTAPAWSNNGDTFVINCKAANALGGITSFTVTLNVIEQTYTNTKSLKFVDGVSSYLGGNAALVTALERSGNGSGASDAWTFEVWLKGSTSNTGQTLLYYGANDVVNGGYIELKQTNHNGLKRLRFRYGSNVNHLQLTTPSGSINPNAWQHVLVSYDGGTTGSSSGSISSYYSRFKIYINKVLQTTSNTHNNYGWSGSIVGQNYRIGRFSSGNYLKNVLLNQLAIWNSDQSSNVVGLYNNGDTQDISLLAAGVGSMNTNYLEPDHYYEIETSVTTIQDLIGNAHLVGYNFSSSDLVNDAP